MRQSALRRLFGAVCLIGAASPCHAADLGDLDAVPTLDAEGRGQYGAFLAAGEHRAFAVAPGGEWGFAEGQPSRRQAAEKAIAQCRSATFQPCHLYAVDDALVFDRDAWSASWQALSRAAPPPAASAAAGTATGARFPDLAVSRPDGPPLTLSGLRGRVVLVHFWATWCGPCQHELPVLDRLYRQLQGDQRIVILTVAVREPPARSRAWAELQGIALPIYGSGEQSELRLADGGRIEDRRVAPKFPTTYVLDGDGVVVFAQAGPVERWTDYAPLLRRLADVPTRAPSPRTAPTG